MRPHTVLADGEASRASRRPTSTRRARGHGADRTDADVEDLRIAAAEERSRARHRDGPGDWPPSTGSSRRQSSRRGAADAALDLAKAASIERHGGPGTIGVAPCRASGCSAARWPARSPTTTTTCSWSAWTTTTCSPRSRACARPGRDGRGRRGRGHRRGAPAHRGPHVGPLRGRGSRRGPRARCRLQGRSAARWSTRS